jgi:hypothetical protein
VIAKGTAVTLINPVPMLDALGIGTSLFGTVVDTRVVGNVNGYVVLWRPSGREVLVGLLCEADIEAAL